MAHGSSSRRPHATGAAVATTVVESDELTLVLWAAASAVPDPCPFPTWRGFLSDAPARDFGRRGFERVALHR
jgi:hypothetical protein